MTAVLPITQAGATEASGSGWRTHLTALGVSAALILALFHRDAADMVRIWIESSTFNHCTLIVPIIAWLVWQRAPELRQLTPAGWAPGLLLVGAGACAWLLGEAGGVGLIRHLALVLMLQGTVIAILGKAVARGLAFPIFYALFLVPAGEELVPPMQTLTAEMCMFLLGLAGVPAHIEGIFITTPTGYFEVAEACSGVKFLIAMIAFGALVANVCFTSWKRRALFLLASIIVPVLANGVRAWGIIFVAHLTSEEFAVGVDHVVYGWVFFAIVIALLLGVGWRYFDRGINDPWLARMPQSGTAAAHSPAYGFAAAALVLAALPLVWSTAIASSGFQAAPADIELPQVVGWQRVPGIGGRAWQPHFAGADLIRMGRYRNASGQKVDLAIAVFARQQEGRELVGFGQGAVAPESGWSWAAAGAAPPGGRLDRIASFGTVREVASFYRVGSLLTGSEFEVKLETIKTRLLGGPQRAVAVLVSAQAPGEGLSPRPAIDAFLHDLGSIEAVADKASGLKNAR